MRRAKSYSILDHELLHGRYLHRLSHNAMVLYLFLVVVGDRDGKSFYSERAIMEILRLAAKDYELAKTELSCFRLAIYRHPHFWVQELKHNPQVDNPKSREVKPCGEARKQIRACPRPGQLNTPSEEIKNLIRNFLEGRTNE